MLCVRKCVPELGEKPCRECVNKPHQLTREVIASLPHARLSPGAKFWSPVPSSKYEGHYSSFLECLQTRKPFTPDSTLNGSNFGRCPRSRCSYTYTSQADKERHLKLIHCLRGRTFTNASGGPGFMCNYLQPSNGEICTEVFSSKYQRLQHKKKCQHINKRNQAVDDQADELPEEEDQEDALSEVND